MIKWEENTNVLCSKGQQRLFFLRKLNKFNVNKTLMALFYRSFIESILTFSMVCWYGNLNEKDKKRISKIVNICSKIIGDQQTSLSELFDKRVIRKANSILNSKFEHPLECEFDPLPSGRRFRVPILKTNRSKHFFINRVIGYLNRGK